MSREQLLNLKIVVADLLIDYCQDEILAVFMNVLLRKKSTPHQADKKNKFSDIMNETPTLPVESKLTL